jgi:hypothetical protein
MRFTQTVNPDRLTPERITRKGAGTEWRYWRSWVQQLGGSAEFRWTVKWVADDYTERFIEAIREDIRVGLARLANRGLFASY